nr:MAG TPA: hypothetical protein [Caudoviricetes sp.]
MPSPRIRAIIIILTLNFFLDGRVLTIPLANLTI